jgi:serine/threonine protein kinase/tetratricopeptide (TPR) repeat protein
MQPPPIEDVQRAVGDKYEVIDLAAAGGMGAVFRARHRALGNIVAVKVLPPEIAASQMRRERFKREAKLGASLSHPHIVPVYEFDTQDGITFLIMPFVRGDTLEAALAQRSRLEPADALRVVREIGQALETAHRRGIVHRDVKPSNILIEEETGRALLTDWGVAYVEGVTTSSLTAPGAPIGTPLYMSPEQAAGSVDRRADLYSLALVAIEAVTGRRPTPGTEPAALAHELRRLGKLPGALAAALVAPLATHPGDRPESAGAWLALIERSRARRWRRWALAAVGVVVGAAVISVVWPPAAPCRPAQDAPPALAIMPFVVLGTPPYPATQLPEYFIYRFSPVPGLSEVVSFGRVALRTGTRPISNREAADVACGLGARFYVQGSVSFSAPSMTLAATLYEGTKVRGAGKATGTIGSSESDVMDTVWAQILGEGFKPDQHVPIPRHGGKEAIAAYFNAEDAFRRGDYRTARDEYSRVVTADPSFAIAYFRRALVAAQVDPTREGFGAALAGAQHHQEGLSPADSLLLDGFFRLLERGDGFAAIERFKRASELAPDYPHAWFVLGEFYHHFGNLYDQRITEATHAFSRVLDLDPRFAPAIAHLISLTHLAGDEQETARLMREYLKLDSTSVVAEAVAIADTILFGSASAQLKLLNGVCGHSFLALEYLAFQAAEFGTMAQREGPGRRILGCLERRAGTDAERARALRMTVAADLRGGRPDSARATLQRGTGEWAARERDAWILLARVTGLPALGEWADAARRTDARAAPAERDAPRHWLLARVGPDRGAGRHAAALHRLAADSAPLPVSLSLDLTARDALARGDSGAALRLWDLATRRFEVLSVPLELVASLWPLRLDMARVAVARGDSGTAARACDSFATLMGYVDQVALPEIERICRRR